MILFCIIKNKKTKQEVVLTRRIISAYSIAFFLFKEIDKTRVWK